MTAVWILLFVCTSSLPSCSQGDVSVANQSYTSSEECYAEGAKRARGRVIRSPTVLPMAFFLSLNRPFRDGHHTGRSHSPVYRFICAVELNSYEWENSDAQDQFACRLS